VSAAISNITISTYAMVAFGGKRSAESLKIMKEICNREWGLLLLDEVHVVPACTHSSGDACDAEAKQLIGVDGLACAW
jgi:superfamily II DNA or RNA helicase